MPPQLQGLLHRYGGDFSRVQRLVDPLVMAALYLGVAAWRGAALPNQEQLLVAVIVLLLSLVCLGRARLYRSYRTQSLWLLLRRISGGWLLVVLLLSLVGFLSKQSAQFSRVDTLLFALLGWLDLVLVHGGMRRWMRRYREAGGNSRAVLFWGQPQAATQLAAALQQHSYLGLRLVATVDASASDAPARLAQQLRHQPIDLVVVSEPLAGTDGPFAVLSRFCVPVSYLPLWAEGSMRFEVNRLGQQVLVQLWSPTPRSFSLAVKRLGDVVAAALALVLLAPLLLTIAVAVRLSSPGPVLFRQWRAGLGGREFAIVKFRTMFVLAPGASDGVLQATRDDPRVTAVGRLLRRWSLDELPQLWNVLLGQMSLVGPRPHALPHNDHYSAQIAGYMQRHLFRPGLTGLAQVRGLRGETPQLLDMAHRIDADLAYQRDWSLVLDLKTLLLSLACWSAPRAY